MKTFSVSALTATALILLVLGVPIAHAYYSDQPPVITYPTAGENVMFGEFTMSAFGGESDSSAGTDYFTYLMTTEAQVLINSPPLSWTDYYFYQPTVAYSDGEFGFYPQIWTCIGICIQGDATESWYSNNNDVYYVSPSSLTNYIILVGVNTGSSNKQFTVTSCNVQVTVDADSMFAEILSTSCTDEYSTNISFSSSYANTQGNSEIGLDGYNNGSTATFTNTVANGESFGGTCVSNGCSYSYSSNYWVAESSNLNYYPHADTGGKHVYVCQETSGESTC